MTQMRAVQITQYGGTEQLSLNSVAMPKPGHGEILVKIAYAGVNFMDVYTRRGAYAGNSPYASELPLTLGMEGSGWVEALGEDVDGFTLGDRVVFCLSRGSYADFAVVPASKLVLLPDAIGLELAATAYFQGLTAHYLAYDTSRLEPGNTCLIYSGSGGVAQNLIQMLKLQKIRMIATANSTEKCDRARAAGADYVSLDDPQNILDSVAEYTNGQGVDVLFDSVGPALFDTSLKTLKRKGLFIHYGANSGALGLIDPMRLANAGSLYFVRPRLNDHIGTRAELIERSQKLFDLWATKQLCVSPQYVYDLSDVCAAHHALESRKSIGKSILRMTQ
jgi:NADPH2:quinone reductase